MLKRRLGAVEPTASFAVIDEIRMASKPEVLEAVVIGAGWAGLRVSYMLARRGLRHRVLERGRIGETWRTQRWASFRMNTPNVQTVMPGDRYSGSDPEGVLTRDEFVALLEDFVARNDLPVEPDTPVTEPADPCLRCARQRP
jgi:putative flavoprotein involved in K+ transport